MEYEVVSKKWTFGDFALMFVMGGITGSMMMLIDQNRHLREQVAEQELDLKYAVTKQEAFNKRLDTAMLHLTITANSEAICSDKLEKACEKCWNEYKQDSGRIETELVVGDKRFYHD